MAACSWTQERILQSSVSIYIEERELLNTLQLKLDRLFFDRIEESWSLKVVKKSIGEYRIVIDQQPNYLKKIYSIFHLLSRAGLMHDENGKKKFITISFVSGLEHEFSISGIEALDKVVKIFAEADFLQERLSTIFSVINPAITIGFERKPLADLFQPLQIPPSSYPGQFSITHDLAQSLQDEQGDVILTNSCHLSTTSDEILRILEHYFSALNMRDENGRMKTFLKSTRAKGMLHEVNLNAAEIAALEPIFNRLYFMINELSKSEQLNILQMTYSEMIAFYEEFLSEEGGGDAYSVCR